MFLAHLSIAFTVDPEKAGMATVVMHGDWSEHWWTPAGLQGKSTHGEVRDLSAEHSS